MKILHTKDLLKIHDFIKKIKSKGFCSYLEVEDCPCSPGGVLLKIVVEFKDDSFDSTSKYCKDWVLFNSEFVCNYYVETTGSNMNKFIIVLD